MATRNEKSQLTRDINAEQADYDYRMAHYNKLIAREQYASSGLKRVMYLGEWLWAHELERQSELIRKMKRQRDEMDKQ